MHNPVGDQGKTHYENGQQVLSEDQGLDIKVREKQKKSTDNNGLSELEIMLRQKTFTRSEIDRLTELLHSRTVESSNGNGKNSEFHPQETGSALQRPDSFARSSLHETRNESHIDKCAYDGRVSTAIVSSKVLEEDFSTPIELAKAYMGNSSSDVPSMLGLRSQAIREDPGALCNSPFAPPSAAMSLVQKPSEHVGVLENGFATPRLRGRSAIYSMARTPYSKGNSSIYDDYGGPSASSPNGFARELVARSVSKDLALKRRSSVLDDEIGSIGPIRRLRQKTNLSTPSNMTKAKTPFSSSGTEIVSNGSLDPSSSSKTFQKSEDNESMPGTRHTPVPSQSKETARKILQQLQMLSPKEKQFEGKNRVPSEKAPSKLTANMLHGQALRSLENVDSSKILRGAGYSLNNKQKDPLVDKCETSSQRRDKKVAENGPKSLGVSQGSLVPAGTSNGTDLVKDTAPASSLSDSVKKQAATKSPPKKWGFQMSAHEDFFELDDEIPSSEAAVSAKLPEEKKISETPVVDNKVIPVTEDKTSVSEPKASAVSFESKKTTNLGTSDATKVVEKNSSFMFTAAPAASPSFLPVVSVSQPTKFPEKVPEKEPKAPSLLSSSSAKIDEKASLFTFSSSPFIGGSVDLKQAPSAEVKQETTHSLAANASVTTETVPKSADSDNDAKNTQKPEDTVEKLESLSSLPQSTSSFSTVGSKRSLSSPSEGSLNAMPPSIFSLPNSTTSTTNPNPFTSFAFSASSTPAPSSEPSPSASATSSSVLAPVFKFESTPNNTSSAAPSAPIFNFGSTPISTASSTTTSTMPSLNTTTDFKSGSLLVAPSTYSTVSTTSIATDVKANAEKESNLGNPPSNPFSATSFPSAGTGSSIFGFTATSFPSAGTSSVTAVSAESMPAFVSTAPSSTLGGSGSSTLFATGSSLFSSSTSSSSVFGNSTTSGFVFGSSSTSSSSLFSSSTSSNSLFSPTTSNIGSSSSFGVVTSAPSSTSFVFGAPPSQTPAFGSSASATSSPSFFSFNSAPQSQPGFGSTVVPAFGSAPGGNNGDQMTMAEDSMAEDQVQAGPTPTPSVPIFGQTQVQNPSPSPFMFGQTPPPSSTGAVPFQFGGQQSQPNPFMPSGNSFGGGGSSFSLGSGGGGDDKSGRRTVRIKRTGRRK